MTHYVCTHIRVTKDDCCNYFCVLYVLIAETATEASEGGD